MHASWDHTVNEHRSTQRDSIAAAAWALARENGPFAVTMTQVAEAAGVSRPTLYKYFTDIESMLVAHHRRHVEAHIGELVAILSESKEPGERLEQLVVRYAEICHRRARNESAEMTQLVHSPFEMAATETQLVELFAQAIVEVGAGRGDLDPTALAAFAVRALAAAADVPPHEVPALARLVVQALTVG